VQVKDRAIVLRTTRYSEHDLIVQCITSSGAKLNLFARSALRSKKRFGGGVLEPTHFIHILYQDKSSKGADHPLHTLNEATLINAFPKLRSDYARLETALHAVQVVSVIAHEGDTESESIFNLLGNTLKAAETSSSLDALKTHFEVKLLTLQGVLSSRRRNSSSSTDF
jgi:DNA repair protein RecO (recombination protein O)